MSSHRQRGFTSVLAIVLLLLLTVSAVSVVYTQFNQLASGQNVLEQAEELQKRQQAEYSIIGVERNEDNEYNVTIKNTGDVTMNLEKHGTMIVGVNGERGVASSVRGGECTQDFGRLRPGSTKECDTDISWQDTYNDDGASSTFELQLGSVVKASYTCVEKSGSRYC